MANRENCLELAAFIERAEYEFDMADARFNLACGSAGCIGGHAAVLWPDVRYHNNFDDKALCGKLDISCKAKNRLCYLCYTGLKFTDITRAVAVRALRNLAETGKVKFAKDDGAEIGGGDA